MADIVDARWQIEAAPDEHTEMRYPTRASESANRRLSSSASCAAQHSYFGQLQKLWGARHHAENPGQRTS
ncbi:hypothetical protein, partial [Acidocella aminolytica]|uniref:hypothetical protein n=1 Tax=Acidocella aminolytica TaxID=33998 RepID=UPI001C31C3DC